MSTYEIPGIGRIYSERVGKRAVKICAEIAEYTRICLTMEMEPLKQGIEQEIENLFTKYESILVEGFVKGLTYVATMIDVERRAGTSLVYM